MTWSDSVQVFGKCNIFMNLPNYSSAAMVKLGESLDMLDTEQNEYNKEVPGDANGGPDGPPIEIQFLGLTYTIRLNLSKYDPTFAAAMEGRGVNATTGTILDAEIGALKLLSKSSRLCIVSAVTGTAINFPCCLIRDAISYGQGTKFSTFSATITAYRAPVGHASAGIIKNNTSTGLPSA